MRIVGGVASGRRLVAPPGNNTRPTGERVREALFNSLAWVIPGARVLDLYAGSGAIGLEAISWGARWVLMVEPDHRARTAIHTNITSLAMADKTTVWPMAAEAALPQLIEADPFDVVICDPPWDNGLSSKVVQTLPQIVSAKGWVIVEHRRSDPSPKFSHLEWVKTRQYGDTALSWWSRPVEGED